MGWSKIYKWLGEAENRKGYVESPFFVVVFCCFSASIPALFIFEKSPIAII